MPQEFLAFFAVDIDEPGVNRLQQVRELYDSLSPDGGEDADPVAAVQSGSTPGQQLGDGFNPTQVKTVYCVK